MSPQPMQSDPMAAVLKEPPPLEPSQTYSATASLRHFVWENRWWAIIPVVLLLLGLLLIAALSAGNPLPYLYQQ